MIKKILLVDDEMELLAVISAHFGERGWTVELAHTGVQALEKVESFCPNVILSDIHMPKMTGVEFLKILFEAKTDIPVIFLTGFRDIEKMKAAWAYGAFDFLDKPIKIGEIVNVCENAFLYGKEYCQSSRARFLRLKKAS